MGVGPDEECELSTDAAANTGADTPLPLPVPKDACEAAGPCIVLGRAFVGVVNKSTVDLPPAPVALSDLTCTRL